ncbi:hypothetical protein AA0498_0156 [Acidomonas methanolica]|nr:hypothetical protein AA0498_0156 [Acidomonas methanolica]
MRQLVISRLHRWAGSRDEAKTAILHPERAAFEIDETEPIHMRNPRGLQPEPSL